MAEVRPAAASILDRIGEATLDRARVRAKVATALAKHQLVTLRGLPGSGKSVMLRREVEAALSRGPTLLLKADRLTGSSWAQYATSIGLAEHDPVPLLREIATVGTPTLFIDGLGRPSSAAWRCPTRSGCGRSRRRTRGSSGCWRTRCSTTQV